MINILQGDCMDLMRSKPDKFWDLAHCDVNYGIGEDGSKNHTRGKLAIAKNYKAYAGNDLNAPDAEYWKELFRVSKNQIIWGANHFISKIPFDSSAWIVWDKMNGDNDFADCELAWTSYDCAVRKFSFRWAGMLQGNMKNKQERIHPNEKPIELYKWVFNKYATLGQKILDTHGGSFSHAIAAYDLGFDLDIIEIDEDYFKTGKERFDNHVLKCEEIKEFGYAKTEISKIHATLF